MLSDGFICGIFQHFLICVIEMCGELYYSNKSVMFASLIKREEKLLWQRSRFLFMVT